MRPAFARRLAAVALLGASALAATTARAVPVQWSVDHAASPLAISVRLQNPFLGTRNGGGSTALSGSVDSDLVDPAGSPSITLQDSGIALDDASFAIALGGLFGSVTVTYDSVAATLTGGPALGVPSGPGAWAVDMTGAVLALDAGFIHATHPLMSQTTDLAATPLLFGFGPTSATYTATDIGGNQLALSMTLPVDLWASLAPIPAPIIGNVSSTVRMTGTLRMTAMTTLSMPVPEPGTALLVTAGIVGLGVYGRRR
jgi:hypothetical protein